MTLNTPPLGVVCHNRLEYDTVYLMILASDILDISLGASKFEVGHVTLTTPPLSVLLMLRLDMQAKFDHSSFSHSGDIVGANQNLNGSHKLTTPLLGTFCHA